MKNKYYMFCRVCLGDKVKVHFSSYLLRISYQKRIKLFTPWPAKSLRSTALLQSDPQFHCNIYKILHNIQQRYDFIFLNLNQFRFISALFKRKDGRGDGVKTQETFKCSYPMQSVGLDLHVNFLEFKSCVWSSNYLQKKPRNIHIQMLCNSRTLLLI